MTMKRVETVTEQPTLPPLDVASLPADLPAALKFGPLGDAELQPVAVLRGTSEPWAKRGETPEESLQALTQLRPFVYVARLQGQIVGYVTVERDGPVAGAAYMRNIVVKPELRHRGWGWRSSTTPWGSPATCTGRPWHFGWIRRTPRRWPSTGRPGSPRWRRW